jgi:CheY-like chemotaxis protein
VSTRRVLIIEDDVLTAAILADQLRERDWEVEVRHSAADGYAAALSLRPDILLVDVVLPEMDGAALCAALRLAPGARLPVVLCSTREVSDELSRSVGADLFLSKPLAPEIVHQALLRLLPAAGAAPSLPVAPATRLPAGDVVGPDSHVQTGEEGIIEPGWFVPFLLVLHRRKFTGVLEMESGEWKAKMFLERGELTSARSSGRETELGRVLEQLGLQPPLGVEGSAEEARRLGRPLGEQLIDSSLLDRASAERALREQIVLRAQQAANQTEGKWRLVSAQAVGLAGFEVPAGVVAWRCGEVADGELTARDEKRFIRVHLPLWAWRILSGRPIAAEAVAAISAGARVSDCRRAGGELAVQLIAVLCRFEAGRLTTDPPTIGPSDEAADRADLDALESRISSQHRMLADADHYTVLGLHPDATSSEIHLAALTAISAFHPDTLPPAITPGARQRAQQLTSRYLEARRVLEDPERRSIYNALISGQKKYGYEPFSASDDALAERARAALERGDHCMAAALFRIAAANEPTDVDVLAMLGRARHLACPDDPEAGIPELRRAVSLDPTAEYALYWLAMAHHEHGESDSARGLLRRALLLNHEFDLARDALRDLDP